MTGLKVRRPEGPEGPGIAVLTGCSDGSPIPTSPENPVGSFVFGGPGTGIRDLDAKVAVPLPAGTVANLRVLLSSVADFPIQFTVIKNGASTALGCDIIAGENSCENLADAVAFDNFDTLSLGMVNPIAQPSQPFLKWSLTLGPPSP